MDEDLWLAERFAAHGTRLKAVAYRMLGSPAEADDAVQETWLRLSRSDASQIENMGGWLTTVVARVSLDMLRSRESRREDPIDERDADAATQEVAIDPEHEALLGESVGIALLVVLEALTPAERVAFVLHDMFDLSFDEIAPIVGRSSTAARQLASRARRRVQGTAALPEMNHSRQRKVVDAFLQASRGGDFQALLELLDPEVVLRADAAAVQMGADAEVRGAAGVAQTFSGRAKVAELAMVNGAVGAVWAQGGTLRVAFSFVIADGKVVEIHLVADPERLAQLGLEAIPPTAS